MSTQVPESTLIARNRCSLYLTSDLTPLTSTWFNVPFLDEDYDTNGMHENVTYPHRITIKESGYYGFGATARFNASTTGGIKIQRFNSSGTNIRGGTMTFVSTNLNILNISKEFYLNAGDYLVMQVYTTVSTSVTHNSVTEPEANCSFWCAMRSK